MTRARLKRALWGLLAAWFVLGGVAYAFYPWALTGNRAADAVLVSAIATVLLAELAEVLSFPFAFFKRQGAKERLPGPPSEGGWTS